MKSWATPEASVEAERVFIQVCLKVLAFYSTVMGAEQPSLHIRENPVHVRHILGVLAAALNYRSVSVTLFAQGAVARSASSARGREGALAASNPNPSREAAVDVQLS